MDKTAIPDLSEFDLLFVPGEVIVLLFFLFLFKDPIVTFIKYFDFGKVDAVPLKTVPQNQMERSLKDLKRSIKYSKNSKCVIFVTNNDGTYRKKGSARPYFTKTGTLLLLLGFPGFQKIVVIEPGLYETNHMGYITLAGNSFTVKRNAIVFLNPYFTMSMEEATIVEKQRNKFISTMMSNQLAVDIAEIQSQNTLKAAMERAEIRSIIEHPSTVYQPVTTRQEAIDDEDPSQGVRI